MIRRTSRLAAAMLLILALAAAGDGAHAHAVLVESTPGDGAVLDRPPDRLKLRFNEPVRLTSLRLVDEAGQMTALAQGPQSRPDQVQAPIPSLSPGSHVITAKKVNDCKPMKSVTCHASGSRQSTIDGPG